MKVIIKKVKIGKMLANASLEFGDMRTNGIAVSGFKILNGTYDDTGYHDEAGNPIWVAPPSYQDNVGNYKNIFFASPATWKEIQNKIIESYLHEFVSNL